MNFLSQDGPFVKFMSLVADIIMLSVIWFILCIPVVTIGPATTAMYFVMTRRIYEKEAYIFSDFIKSFKQNFVQSMLTWFTITIPILLVLFNMYLVNKGYVFANNKIIGNIALSIYLIILFELILIYTYAFPIIARFHMSFKEALKTSFMLSNKHLPTSLGLLAIVLLMVLTVNAIPICIFISEGLIVAFSSFFFMRIFRKYIPDMDMYESEISYDAINEKDE